MSSFRRRGIRTCQPHQAEAPDITERGKYKYDDNAEQYRHESHRDGDDNLWEKRGRQRTAEYSSCYVEPNRSTEEAARQQPEKSENDETDASADIYMSRPESIYDA